MRGHSTQHPYFALAQFGLHNVCAYTNILFCVSILKELYEYAERAEERRAFSFSLSLMVVVEGALFEREREREREREK